MNKALLVGINAYPSAPLHGCVNDVQDMAGFLVAKCGFAMEDIRLLTDERATKKEIIKRLGWLLSGIRPGDRIVFHFSGHGAQMATRNAAGEIDKLDEIICPVDSNWTDETAIRDKEFNSLFRTVTDGVIFTWISDSCNSGDLFKLIPGKNRTDKTMPAPADMRWRIETAKRKGIKPLGLARVATNFSGLFISGCRSDQTSQDALINGRFNGALSFYLLETLDEPNGLVNPMVEILGNTRQKLKNEQFAQEPQLEGNEQRMKFPFLTEEARRIFHEKEYLLK